MTQTGRAIISCGLLFGVFLFLHFRSYGEKVPAKRLLDSLPRQIDDWQGQEDTTLDADILGILKLNDYVMRRYRDLSGRDLWLYIAYWDTQRKGAQIHSPKHCLPGGGWEPLEAKQLPIVLASPLKEITVNRYVLQKDQYQQVVTYWFQSQGSVVASEVDAKLQLVKNALLRNRTDGALVRLVSPVSGSVEETFHRQAEFVRALSPILKEFLPE